MILKFKTMLMGVILFLGITSSSALPIVDTIIEKGIEKLLDKLLDYDENATIVMDNVDLINTVKVSNSELYFTNAGIKITGKNIKITDTEIYNEVTVTDSTSVFSNLGVKLGGGGKVDIANSFISNYVELTNGSQAVASNLGVTVKN